EHEVGDGIAGDVTGEREQSARIVGGLPSSCEAAQIETSTNVVRAAVPRENVRGLERRVELVPVGSTRRQRAEVAGVHARKPWVVVYRVAVDPRNPQRRPGALLVVDRELVQRVEVQPMVADTEVVDQRWRQRVGVGDERVLVYSRLRDTGR